MWRPADKVRLYLLVHTAQQVESLVGRASYHSQTVFQGEARQQARLVDRVDLSQAQSERDEEKEWGPVRL